MRKRRKLERRKCGLDIAGAVREELEVVWRKSQNRKQEEKKNCPEVGASFGTCFHPKTETFWRRNNL